MSRGTSRSIDGSPGGRSGSEDNWVAGPAEVAPGPRLAGLAYGQRPQSFAGPRSTLRGVVSTRPPPDAPSRLSARMLALPPPAPERSTLFECRIDTLGRRRALRLRNLLGAATVLLVVAIPLGAVAWVEPIAAVRLIVVSAVASVSALLAFLILWGEWQNKRAEAFVLRLTDWGVEFSAPVLNSQLGGVVERGGAIPWERLNEVRQAPWWFARRYGLLEVDFFPFGYHRNYPVLTVPAVGPWRIDVPWLLQADADTATRIAQEQIALHPSILPRTPVFGRARGRASPSVPVPPR